MAAHAVHATPIAIDNMMFEKDGRTNSLGHSGDLVEDCRPLGHRALRPTLARPRKCTCSKEWPECPRWHEGAARAWQCGVGNDP